MISKVSGATSSRMLLSRGSSLFFSRKMGIMSLFKKSPTKNKCAAAIDVVAPVSLKPETEAEEEGVKNNFLKLIEDLKAPIAAKKMPKYFIPQFTKELPVDPYERAVSLFVKKPKRPPFMILPRPNTPGKKLDPTMNIHDLTLAYSTERQLIGEKPELPYFTYVSSSRNLRVSHINMNKLARQIKGYTLAEVLRQMAFGKKKGCVFVTQHVRDILKAILSDESIPSEVRNVASFETLTVVRSWVGKGCFEYNLQETNEWGVRRYRTRWSHINVEVALVEPGSLKPRKGNIPGRRPEFLRPLPKIPAIIRPIIPEKPVRNRSKKLFFDA